MPRFFPLPDLNFSALGANIKYSPDVAAAARETVCAFLFNQYLPGHIFTFRKIPNDFKMSTYNVQDLFAPIDKSLKFEIVHKTGQKRSFDVLNEDGGALTRAQSKRLKQEKVASSSEPINDDGNNDDGDDGDDDEDGVDVLPPDPTSTAAVSEQPDPTPSISTAAVSQQPDPTPSTSTAAEAVSELKTTNSDFSKDTVIVENNAVRAHIYQTFLRRQKIFS